MGKHDKAGKAAGKAGKAPGAPGRLGKGEYQDHLAPLQIELNEVSRWLLHTGQRLVVLVEGRDTAGKGGVIAAIAETLNPRQCRVVALPKPTEREAAQWYFQRYVSHLPAAGEMVLFDRSWYNRAGVETVMGFCTKEELSDFLKGCPVVERWMVKSGILLIKIWLEV
ncbi:MAG: polyphosphate kinase 2, partial [Burkholderiales bacterium]|nr:polyphosphate kinase 2 [Burkholderiales bacterium]